MLKTNKKLTLKFFTMQLAKKKKRFFFSTLQSPHVNKKYQEQFEYYKYNKELKIHVFKWIKFLTVWKKIKTRLFSDIRLDTKILFNTSVLNKILWIKIDSDKFLAKYLFKKKLPTKHISVRAQTWQKKKTSQDNKIVLSSFMCGSFLKLLDIYGEIWLWNNGTPTACHVTPTLDNSVYKYTYDYTYTSPPLDDCGYISSDNEEYPVEYNYTYTSPSLDDCGYISSDDEEDPVEYDYTYTYTYTYPTLDEIKLIPCEPSGCCKNKKKTSKKKTN